MYETPPQSPVLAAGQSSPVEHGCVSRDELCTGLHSQCDNAIFSASGFDVCDAAT
jgi:hypothetical protein